VYMAVRTAVYRVWGDTIGVDGAGESGTVEVAGADVGLCVASGV